MKSETRRPRPGTQNGFRRPRRIRFRTFGLVSSLGLRPSVLPLYWLLAIGYGLLSAATPPFLRLRDASLGYHGTADDFTYLTEVRIGWFGPTNLDDPLTGDLWWAATLAVQEANERRAQAPEAGSSRGVARLSEPDPQTADQETGDVNRTSDFTRLPFRLVPRWAVDPWGTGVSQLARMVYEEQPLAVIGSVDSATTHLAEQVVAKANLPLVSPIATDPSITLAGVSWMFACAPSDAAIARVLVDDILATLSAAEVEKAEVPSPKPDIDQGLERPAAVESPWFLSDRLTRREPPALTRPPGTLSPTGGEGRGEGAPRLIGRTERSAVALLTCTDHESRMTTRAVLREFSRRGRAPDFQFDVPAGAPAFSRQLTALAQAAPSALLIVAGAEDAARLVQAVRNLPAPCPVLFGSQSMGRARFEELAGPAAEGVRFPLLAMASPADDAGRHFVAHFTAERHHAPDDRAMLTYDATRLVIEAIHRAGPNRARIRETLMELSPWPGIAGTIRFDGTGQNTRSNVSLATLRGGAVVPFEPRTLAQRVEPAHLPKP